MNIPTTLVNELKLYLKQQANKGDLEAQILLSQIEQVADSLSEPVQQAMDVPPSEGIGLGC
jgi:hypothetical protein